MTFPHRLKFVLFLICGIQHALALNSTEAYVNVTNAPVTLTSSSMSAIATEVPTSTTHDTIKSSNADVNITSAPVTILSSASTVPNGRRQFCILKS